MDLQAVIRRDVARVLLFDPQDRLLLFYIRDPADPTGDPWWYLPGGGMDPGESPEQAARRELFEETGIQNAEIGPVVLEVRGIRFRFGGRDYEQDEWHVLGRLRDGDISIGGGDDLEADAVAAHRWWTLVDLETSSEVVYPPGLAATVGRLFREGPPAAPWEIDPSYSPTDLNAFLWSPSICSAQYELCVWDWDYGDNGPKWMERMRRDDRWVASESNVFATVGEDQYILQPARTANRLS